MFALDKLMVVSEEYKETINCETIYLTFSLKKLPNARQRILWQWLYKKMIEENHIWVEFGEWLGFF